MFALAMMQKFYASYGEKVDAARKKIGRPLTYTEKYCLLTLRIIGRTYRNV